jgi:hypothetical protein
MALLHLSKILLYALSKFTQFLFAAGMNSAEKEGVCNIGKNVSGECKEFTRDYDSHTKHMRAAA